MPRNIAMSFKKSDCFFQFGHFSIYIYPHGEKYLVLVMQTNLMFLSEFFKQAFPFLICGKYLHLNIIWVFLREGGLVRGAVWAAANLIVGQDLNSKWFFF